MRTLSSTHTEPKMAPMHASLSNGRLNVVAWNLAHQVRERPIPECLPALFASMEADVVLLNEFVDGPTREEFRNGLRYYGYDWQAVSDTPGKFNQVFAASRRPFTVGYVKPPTLGDRMHGPAIAGFLHICFERQEVEMVGFRAPFYKRAADINAYWGEMTGIMSNECDRAILFAGDINYNPFKRAGVPSAASMQLPGCPTYTVPNPAGDWSFQDRGGKWKATRIDHVLHTSAVTVGDVRYVACHNGTTLAGLKSEHPISDHAALAFTVSRV